MINVYSQNLNKSINKKLTIYNLPNKHNVITLKKKNKLIHYFICFVKNCRIKIIEF